MPLFGVLLISASSLELIQWFQCFMVSIGSVVIQPIRHIPEAMKYRYGRMLDLHFDHYSGAIQSPC